MKKDGILKLTLIILFISIMLLFTSCGKQYTVTFDSDGGSEVDAQIIDAGGFAKEPVQPEREGYTFAGWYRNLDKWDFEHYAIGLDLTLTAKWIPNYTVTFDEANGSDNRTLVLPEGSLVQSPGSPTREGFEFLGWYAGDEKWSFNSDTVSENTVLTAKWSALFTVSFDSDGGSIVSEQTVKEGLAATAPTAPLKSGYIFAGWFNGDSAWDFASPVTESMTLKAKWLKQFTVHFDTDGGADIAPVYVIEGSLISAPAAITKLGYVFDYWYDSADSAMARWDFSAPLNKDITLKAKWKKIHTVSFDSLGGSVVTELYITDGELIPVPQNPTREFYLFDSWQFGENGAWDFANARVTSDITLTAKWKANYYIVSFDLAGGTGDFPQQMVTLGEKIREPYNVPERDGFAFVTWRLNDQRWNFALHTITEHSTITLVAEWSSNYWVINFDIDGNTTHIPAQKVPKDGGLIQMPVSPEKTGYAFVGWTYSTPSGDEIWRFDESPSSDMTLKAKWAEKYTVTFNPDGGSAVDPLEVVDGNLLTKPDNPTKTGYEFVAWVDSADREWNFATDRVTSDMTLNAKWLKKILVSFDFAGGTIDGLASIPPYRVDELDGKLEDPGVPVKDGYIFLGWLKSDNTYWSFDTDTTFDSITLTADWRKIHTLTFDLNGGAGNFTPVKVPDGEKTTIPPVVPQMQHYVFEGWCKMGTEAFWDWTAPVTSDVVLVAKWKPRNYIIKFDVKGGDTPISNQNVTYGSLITEPDRESMYRNEYFIFVEWRDAETNLKWDFTKTPERNMTLYAYWEQIGEESPGGTIEGPWVGTTVGPPDILD